MHRYRTHTCGALRPSDVGASVRLSGWCHRIRDHGGVLFIDLRDHYGLTQCVVDSDSPAFKAAEHGPLGMGRAPRRPRPHPSGRHRERRAADRRGRDVHRRARGAGRGRRAAPAGLRRPRISRGDAAALSLPRPAPGEAPRQHHEARRDRRLASPPHAGGRVLRVPDADPDGVEPRGRARLPRPVPRPSGQVLRAAAGAAAVQAADDDRRLRPLFPDRPLLPRRGCPRGPEPGRVLPARHRDELRHAGGRLPGGGAGAARGVQGVRGRQARHRGVPAHHVRRCDAEIRRRQARPAKPAGDRRRDGRVRRRRGGVQGVQGRDQVRRRGPRDPGDRSGDAAALLLRQAQRLRPLRGRTGPGLRRLRGGRRRA